MEDYLLFLLIFFQILFVDGFDGEGLLGLEIETFIALT